MITQIDIGACPDTEEKVMYMQCSSPAICVSDWIEAFYRSSIGFHRQMLRYPQKKSPPDQEQIKPPIYHQWLDLTFTCKPSYMPIYVCWIDAYSER